MTPTEFAPSLTSYERDIRERFVDSYMKDFNEVRACIRIGYQESYAREFGPRFMKEPYVLNLIAERKKNYGKGADRDTARDEIVGMLKLEAQRENSMGGTHAGRVSALVQLSKILGIEAPAKVEVTDTTAPKLDHLTPAELEDMRHKLYGPTPVSATTH